LLPIPWALWYTCTSSSMDAKALSCPAFGVAGNQSPATIMALMRIYSLSSRTVTYAGLGFFFLFLVVAQPWCEAGETTRSRTSSHCVIGLGSHGRCDKDGTLAVTNSDFKCFDQCASSNGATLLICLACLGCKPHSRIPITGFGFRDACLAGSSSSGQGWASNRAILAVSSQQPATIRNWMDTCS
jgi:hypothetical protein